MDGGNGRAFGADDDVSVEKWSENRSFRWALTPPSPS
jgi:hypothetical protein